MKPDKIHDVERLLRKGSADDLFATQRSSDKWMRCDPRLVRINDHEASSLRICSVPQRDGIAICRNCALAPGTENDKERCAVLFKLTKRPLDLITRVRLAVTTDQTSNESTHRTATTTRPEILDLLLLKLEHGREKRFALQISKLPAAFFRSALLMIFTFTSSGTTSEPGGTLCDKNTFAPMVLPSPTTVSPPIIVAPA